MRKHESHHSHRSSASRHDHYSKKDRQRLIYDSKHDEHRRRSRSRSSSGSRHRSPSFSLLRDLCQGASFENLSKSHSREIEEIRAGLRSKRLPDPYQISYTPVLVSDCDLLSSVDASQKVRFDLQFDMKPLQQAKDARKEAEQKESEARVKLEAVQEQLRAYASR